MANDTKRMIKMPDGKQYPLMPEKRPDINPYADRAAAQEEVNRDAYIGWGGTPAGTKAGVSPEVVAFAEGKKAANGTPNLFRTPVTEPDIQAAMNRPAVIQRNNTEQEQTNEQSKSKNNTPSYQNDKQYKQPITSTEELAAAMGYTSPEEENRLRKASLMNQRILAVGDALRHIGNIANTVNYAPAQQYNSPVLEEQARYEKGKAMRDRANQQYIAYQQAKAKQDAEQRRWEAQFNYNQAKDERNYKFNAAKAAAELAERQRQYDETAKRNREKDKIAEEQWNRAFKQKEQHQKQQMGLGWYNAKTSRMNAERLAEGDSSKKSPLDTPYGRLKLSGKTNDSDQIRQMWAYARDLGLTSQSDIDKRLKDLGLGKEDSDAAKRQIVMDLMRSDGRISKYAADRLDAEFLDGYPSDGIPYAPQPQTPFYSPWGGGRETIPGYVVGSSTASAGKKETIPGFKIGG